jgi:hypothetical protein
MKKKLDRQDTSMSLAINQDALKVFIDAAGHNPSLREFNEHDIIGDLERDTHGILKIPAKGKDRKNRKVNSRGYLFTKKGIIDNRKG